MNSVIQIPAWSTFNNIHSRLSPCCVGNDICWAFSVVSIRVGIQDFGVCGEFVRSGFCWVSLEFADEALYRRWVMFQACRGTFKHLTGSKRPICNLSRATLCTKMVGSGCRVIKEKIFKQRSIDHHRQELKKVNKRNYLLEMVTQIDLLT